MESTKYNQEKTDDEQKMRSFGEELKSFFVGDDIFISYARGDSTGYALALANCLGTEGFICYLDQYGTNPNDEIDERIKRKLRRSRVMVLIGSQLAINSGPIRQEVELFKKTERAIIPIDVDGAFRGTKLYEVVRGLPLAAEEMEIKETETNLSNDKPSVVNQIVSEIKNLRKVPPSGRVIDRIKSTISYTKRTQLQRSMMWAGSIFLTVSVSFAVISLIAAGRARASAAQERVNAEAARKEAQRANDQAKSAHDSALTAAINQAVAEIDLKVADGSRRDAEVREKVAEVREVKATQNARQQERLAESLEEVEQTTRLVEERPAEAFAVRASALSKAPDAVGTRSGLLNALKRYPRLESIVTSNYNSPITKISSALKGRVVAFVNGNYDLHSRNDTNDTISFYDTETRSILPSPPVAIDRVINQVSCTPLGDVCAASTDHNILVWQFKLINQKLSVEPFAKPFYYGSYPHSPSSLAISGDKRLVAAYDLGDPVLSWDLAKPNEKPNELNLKQGCSGPTLALSPDDKTLVLGCQYEVQFWDFNNFDVPPVPVEFPGLMGGIVNNVVFSDDGKYLAVGYTNGTVLLIDAIKRQVRGSPFKDVGPEITFATIKDSNPNCSEKKEPSLNWPFTLYSDLPVLITGNAKGHMIYWSLKDCPEPVPILTVDQMDYPPGIRSVTSLRGRANSFVVGGGDGSLAVWNMNAKPLLDSFNRSAYPMVEHLGFDQSGTILSLNGGTQYNTILNFSGNILSPIQSSVTSKPLLSRRFLPWAYTIGHSEVWIVDPMKPRNEVQKLPIDAHGVIFAAVNANATLVAAVTDDNDKSAPVKHHNVVLWDRGKNKLKSRKPLEDSEDATCVVFSRNGKLLAVGYETGRVVVWDLARGKKIRELKSALTVTTFDARRNPRVTALAFSDDGKMIAASSDYTPLSLWDTKTGSLLSSLESGPALSGDGASALAFSPNGKKLIASSYYGLSVWDTDPHSWVQRALSIANLK